MKPNFALNLSHEGISLLHRAQAGWLRVGDVSLEDPALADELNTLRKTAADLESGGLTTKLVIPNSQILYTDIDAPGPQTADRIGQIRDGLVGLTPYDVNDLVFDWRMKGKVAQVAVVARDTLREAESFATQYRFNPVSFVAVPTNGAFEGEPFFGPTRHAASLLTGGETVQPDQEAIRVLVAGAAAPKAKPAEKPKPAKAPKTAPKPAATVAVAEAALAKNPGPHPVAPPPEVVESAPAVTFASRRANGIPAVAAPAKLDRIPPRIALAADPATAKTTPAPSAKPTATPTPGAAKPAPYVLPKPTPLPVTAPNTAPEGSTTEKRAKAKKARTTAKAATSALAGTLGKLGRGASQAARREPVKAPAKPAVAPIPAAAPRNARTAVSEAEAMTVFGARGKAQQRGKPRYLGLILTLLLLLALAILALWSTYFMSDVTSGWFGTFEEDTEIAATVPDQAPPVIVPPTPVVVPEAATTPAPTEQMPPDPVVEATPEIATDAPTALETPQSAIDAAVETALLDAPTETTPVPETTPEAPETAPALQEPQVEVPLPEVEAPAPVDRKPLTRPEAETRYAATGIWQLAPDPSQMPETDRLDDLYVASIDPVIASQDAVALPTGSSQPDELQPTALTPPVPLGTTFDFDARGFVRATPGGALTPEGVVVYEGRPPVAGRPRPADLAVPEQDTRLEPEVDRFRLIRPPFRPGNLAEGNERARLGGFSATELAAIRPSVRPALFQQPETAVPAPEETVDAAPPPDDDADSATALAVSASRAPTTRPSGFASLVEKALKEATVPEKPAARTPSPQADTKPETTVAAARMPPVPSRASVAKQATVANAINLSKVNLIGVYGSPSQRRALVRLPSGRYVKVKVGDRVDGGQVAAIGDTELRYIKRGRNITLTLPKG